MRFSDIDLFFLFLRISMSCLRKNRERFNLLRFMQCSYSADECETKYCHRCSEWISSLMGNIYCCFVARILLHFVHLLPFFVDQQLTYQTNRSASVQMMWKWIWLWRYSSVDQHYEWMFRCFFFFLFLLFYLPFAIISIDARNNEVTAMDVKPNLQGFFFDWAVLFKRNEQFELRVSLYATTYISLPPLWKYIPFIAIRVFSMQLYSFLFFWFGTLHRAKRTKM